MIEEVYLANFKSVRATRIPLAPFACLIGPNNSGKSNILSALRFLQLAASQGLQNAIANAGGETLRHFGAKDDEPITIGITLAADSTSGAQKEPTLKYTLSFSLDARASIKEDLSSQAAGDADVELASSTGTYRGGTRQITFHETGRPPGPLRERVLQTQAPALMLNGAVASAAPLRAFLQGMQFFHFAPENLKAPGQVLHQTTLDYAGQNFATYLHYIHSGNKRAFNRIEEQLVKNFPDVEELISPVTTAGTAAGIRERWFEKSVNGQQLSDGLAGFLAHLVVLYGPESPTLVSFEEPENYVNPRLLERLATMLRVASKSSQVLITTHSTSLLNHLELGEVLVVDRLKGETTVRRAADSKELREHLKDWALGDAYVSGALGGVP